MHPASSSVPRHEPEVVEAEAKKRYGGDQEKVATTSIANLCVNGISLQSRYGKAHEFDKMAVMAKALPPELARRVESIFCDSKAQSCYCVSIPVWDADLARTIGLLLEEASLGHNGITLYQGSGLFGLPDGESVTIEPEWFETF